MADHNDGSDMRPEYDFSHGVRGKHYREGQDSHTLRVRKADGTIEEQQVSLVERAIILDPDVKEHFPDSESVNRALRSLIRKT